MLSSTGVSTDFQPQTPCECEVAAYCRRHRRHMAKLHWTKCQSGLSDSLSQMYGETFEAITDSSEAGTQEKKKCCVQAD